MMHALYVLQLAKRHISGWANWSNDGTVQGKWNTLKSALYDAAGDNSRHYKAMLNSEEIEPEVTSTVELYLAEGISE